MGSSQGNEGTGQSSGASAGRYRRLVDGLADGVFRIGANGSFQAVNDTFVELAGRERSELLETNYGIAFSEPSTERIDGLMRSLLSAADTDTDTISVDLVTAAGETVRCQLRLTVITEGSDLLGASCLLRCGHDDADAEGEREPVGEVFDRLTDAVFALDREGRFTYVNEKAESVLGKPESELLDTVAWDLFSGSRRAQFEQHCERALRTQESTSFEEFNPDDETWFDVQVHPSQSGVSVHFRDITERKEQEAELNEREQRLVMLAESLNEIVWMATPDGEEMVFINSAYEDVWGRDPEALHEDSMAFLEGVHPEDRDQVREAFESLPEEEYDETFRVVRPDGTVRWVESHGSAVENSQGEVVRIVGTAQDITERRQAQEALRERERQLSTLMSNVPGMVYRRRDDDGWPMEFVSEGCTDLTGYDPERLEENDVVWSEDVVEDDRSEHREEIMVRVENRESFAVTYRIETADGETRWVREQGRGVFEDGDLQVLEGVITDVTERVQYEQTLERREKRLRETYDIIADNDRSFDDQLQGLLEVGREVTDTEYAALGRVNNEDYVFNSVIASDDDVQPGDVVPMSTRVCERTVDTESSLRLDDIEAEAPELADRGDYEAHDVNCYLGAPVFVNGDVYGVLCFYGPDGGEDRFTEWQSTFADIISRWVGTELETKRHTEQLAALNELNGVVRGVSDAVIDQSTREEVEEITCERLAASDSYQFAWLGEPNTKTQQVEPRAKAGAEGYLDGVEVSVAPENSDSGGPTAQALRSSEIETVRNIQNTAADEPWQEAAAERGFRSVAAVPVVHEDTTYGVLNIYTERSDAFESGERAVLEHLGELVGHAIAAVERKRALMTDEVVELEFAASNLFAGQDGRSIPEGTVSFDRSIPTGDGRYLIYATADGDVVDSLEEVADAIPMAESITDVEKTGDRSYRLRLSEPPVISTIASLGGSVEQAVIEDGDFRMTVHLPSGTDVRQVIDTVQETLPQAEPLARRQVPNADSSAGSGVNTDLDIDLTERQRAAVEAAYFAGFFEWPRDSSGEEVAESLDITSPTFHQHVRAAENKIFSALFGE